MSHALNDAKAIFLGALDCEGADELMRFIEQACGTDAAVRLRVEELLRAHQNAGAFLGGAENQDTACDQPIADGPGSSIGPYRLLQQIGEGGMGTVFMAEQAYPVQRKVALKLIKAGTDNRQVIARFEAERQALALMDHPNIAKVLDGGTSPPREGGGGRPYFVMELVKGVPITRYCDEHHLTPEERLELFIPVCHAVQHAHQKGIIHRDLKPSNVMVCIYDGKPVPKVIDFGVAKATGPKLTERTLFTEFGAIVGTLEYMSPEQAVLDQLDIDTRSDIYSLGVLLYELLTGSTPLERKRITQVAILELLRLVREQEAPRPSTRLSTTEELPSIAANRGTEPRKLSGQLRGELDWIVMKSLEKDRARRYETASAFAADVLHYLHDEPVLAGPPGAGYRVRKFVRRNRGPVLASSLVLLALLGGVIGTTFGLVRTERAARAERQAKETAQRRLTQVEKANEILGSIFKDLDPERAETEGKPLQALLGERLDHATSQLEGEVIGDPLAVARMQLTLARSQLGLGYADRAIPLVSKARTTFTAQLGPDHRETLESMNGLAWGYREAGNLGLALPLFEDTLKRGKATLGPDDPLTLKSMNYLALVYQDSGELDRSLTLYEETLRRRKVMLGPDHEDTLQSMNNLALGYRAADKLGLAVPLFEETLKTTKAKLGPDHAHTLTIMNNLALSYHDAGKLDLAVPLHEETLKRRTAKFGPGHPDTLNSMYGLARGYQADGKPALAVPLFEETLKLAKAKFGPDHDRTLMVMNNLGRSYLRSGQTAKAEPLLRECLAIQEKKEPRAWRTFDAKSMLGAALLGQKNYAGAEPLLLAGYQGLKEHEAKIPVPNKIRLIEALERLIELYATTGQADKAKEWQQKLAEAKAVAKPAARP
jgi:serine/threonine protein kinase/tetratricopeptide (TPR) repeat protein